MRIIIALLLALAFTSSASARCFYNVPCNDTPPHCVPTWSKPCP